MTFVTMSFGTTCMLLYIGVPWRVVNSVIRKRHTQLTWRSRTRLKSEYPLLRIALFPAVENYATHQHNLVLRLNEVSTLKLRRNAFKLEIVSSSGPTEICAWNVESETQIGRSIGGSVLQTTNK